MSPITDMMIAWYRKKCLGGPVGMEANTFLINNKTMNRDKVVYKKEMPCIFITPMMACGSSDLILVMNHEHI